MHTKLITVSCALDREQSSDVQTENSLAPTKELKNLNCNYCNKQHPIKIFINFHEFLKFSYDFKTNVEILVKKSTKEFLIND